jgi:hypothetical protein
MNGELLDTLKTCVEAGMFLLIMIPTVVGVLKLYHQRKG